ncbi:hypothetical protein BJX96DRAFT_187179 [Aspergillus floccosus]
MYTAYPGLSMACQESLATNVTCSPTLAWVANYPLDSNGVMNSDEVAVVCIDECYTMDTDVIVIENVAYPGGSSTGKYCDPQIASWSNQTMTTDQQCSDCWLGGLALQLRSPLGYDDSLAIKYVSLTSSCNATAYSYTTPTHGTYTVETMDDCNSVALALNVSTYGLLYTSGLHIYCQNFAAASDTYVWQLTDNCNSVVSGRSNVTVPQFLVWNPTFNSLCENAVNYVGYVVCIKYYHYCRGCVSYRNYTDTSTFLNSCIYVTSAYEVTTDQLREWNPSITGNQCTCALNPGYSYFVLLSDNSKYSCADIVADFEMTETEFFAWNPWLADDCDAALYANLGKNGMRAFCIGVDTSATTTSSSTLAAPTPTDTVPGCQEFYTVVSGDDCSTIEAKFGIALAEFYAWNPSIGSTCTNLWLQEAYCVKGPASATTTSAIPTQTGIASNCNKYYTVMPGDSCTNIESLYSITFPELYKWNPAIGSNCESL